MLYVCVLTPSPIRDITKSIHAQEARTVKNIYPVYMLLGLACTAACFTGYAKLDKMPLLALILFFIGVLCAVYSLLIAPVLIVLKHRMLRKDPEWLAEKAAKKNRVGSRKHENIYLISGFICLFLTYAFTVYNIHYVTLPGILVTGIFLTLGFKEARRWRKDPPPEELERRVLAERDSTPVKARILDPEDVYANGHSLSTGHRAFAGFAVAGPIGALLESCLKKKSLIKFAVEYESGRQGTEFVRLGSKRFMLLSRLDSEVW